MTSESYIYRRIRNDPLFLGQRILGQFARPLRKGTPHSRFLQRNSWPNQTEVRYTQWRSAHLSAACRLHQQTQRHSSAKRGVRRSPSFPAPTSRPKPLQGPKRSTGQTRKEVLVYLQPQPSYSLFPKHQSMALPHWVDMTDTNYPQKVY